MRFSEIPKDARASSAYLAKWAQESYEAAFVLSRGEYHERVRPWRELIVAIMDAHGVGVAAATLHLAKDLENGGQWNSGAAMWLMAAFYDEALTGAPRELKP